MKSQKNRGIRYAHILTLCALSIWMLCLTSTTATADSAPQQVQLSPEQKKALLSRPKKIVGLVPVRNESQYIDQCLRALALYTDAIIVLDDASTDNTVAIVESLAKECHIERIIKKTVWLRDEPGDRNKMIQAGREIGGTHFIPIDADEMLTAPCLKDNFLRNKILAMEPGDIFRLHWIRLWKSVSQFRLDQDKDKRAFCHMRPFIFCDDGISEYCSGFIHTSRYPTTLCAGRETWIEPVETYGLLHFYAVNWRNLLVKESWYRCLERIRLPNKSSKDINNAYSCEESEFQRCCFNSAPAWFAYPFFDRTAYEAPEQWREKEILSWFAQYGKNFFADLHIWKVDWGAGIQK